MLNIKKIIIKERKYGKDIASSFSAGIGLAFWGSAGQYDLIDMNGDGLVDIVEKGSDNLLVCLNTGDAFAPPINWINADEISNSSSTSESYNSAYTITFPVPFPPSIPAFKIAINQKFSYGMSMTRPRYELREPNICETFYYCSNQ